MIERKTVSQCISSDYCEGWNDAVDTMSKWISADEKIPEDDSDVLVFFEYFRYGEYNRPFRTIGIGSTFMGKWSGLVNGQSGWTDLKIIAWMPLPEPPKGG